MNGIGDIGIRFSSVEAHLVPLSFAIFTFESFWSRSVYFVGRPNMIETQCDGWFPAIHCKSAHVTRRHSAILSCHDGGVVGA